MPKIITTYKCGCYLPISQQFKYMLLVLLVASLIALSSYYYISIYLPAQDQLEQLHEVN